jgi:hypothetical protein
MAKKTVFKPRKQHFPGIDKIAYEGTDSDRALAFRHYDPAEVIDGKTMKEHMRFSIAYWHAFRGTGSDPFGPGTIQRSWENGKDPVSVAKVRMDAAFEFFQKIESPFWCFHDRDIAPEGASLAESNRILDQIVAHAKQLQKATGVRLLWGTANLFSNPRYMSGAATNPDAHVFAYAAAQVKKALEVTQELGGENYVFWGGREGYETLLNTNLKREQDHLAPTPRRSASRGSSSSSRSRRSRPSTSTTSTSPAASPSSAPTGSRSTSSSTSRPTTRPLRGTPSSTKSRSPRPPACSAQSTPTRATCSLAGIPTNSIPTCAS